MTISPVTYPVTYPSMYVAGTPTTSDVEPTTDTDGTTTSTDASDSAGLTGTTDSSMATTGTDTDSTPSVSTELQALLSSAQQTTLNDVGVLLGTSPDDLYSFLQSGTTLSDLMSQSNLDPSLLVSVISNGMLLDTSL